MRSPRERGKGEEEFWEAERGEEEEIIMRETSVELGGNATVNQLKSCRRVGGRGGAKG